MRIRQLHPWPLNAREAIELQKRLHRQLKTVAHGPLKVQRIAGADISWDPTTKQGYAGVIVYTWPGLVEVERVSAQGHASFPYIPGLLSFRETPLLLQAFQQLQQEPDLVFIDGHGYAHPRRFGIACHIGMLLDKPTLGCAKSRLIGEFKKPGQRAGSHTPLKHGRETLGTVVRTKAHVSPIFISTGYRITLAQAVKWALACTEGHRIPKPTRDADKWVGQMRMRDSGVGMRKKENAVV